MKQPTPAQLKILRVIDRIPRGRVATYGQIARLAKLPRRARLVGQTLRNMPDEVLVPWHRVVNAAGRISDRDPRDMRRQRELLLAEGVAVSPTGRIDLTRYAWKPAPRLASRRQGRWPITPLYAT